MSSIRYMYFHVIRKQLRFEHYWKGRLELSEAPSAACVQGKFTLRLMYSISLCGICYERKTKLNLMRRLLHIVRMIATALKTLRLPRTLKHNKHLCQQLCGKLWLSQQHICGMIDKLSSWFLHIIMHWKTNVPKTSRSGISWLPVLLKYIVKTIS